MQIIAALALLLFATPEAVLRPPKMETVRVQKNIAYDGTLRFDLYRPANADGALPVVVFINGIGARELKEWGQYTSWPRLVALRGHAAITYETEGGDAAAQTDALLRHLRANAATLKIDPNRIALWACSSNGRVATALIAKEPSEAFRAAVFYYALMPVPAKHATQPVFVARAGLDALAINESIETWVADAIALEAPLTYVSYPRGRHGFDLHDDTAESRRIISATLDFLDHHLTTPREPGPPPVTPSAIERRLRADGVAAAVKQLRELRQTQPAQYVVSERALNALGYQLLQAKKTAEAVTIMELMVEWYPTANALDSLAEALEAAGRKEEAGRIRQRIKG